MWNWLDTKTYRFQISGHATNATEYTVTVRICFEIVMFEVHAGSKSADGKYELKTDFTFKFQTPEPRV